MCLLGEDCRINLSESACCQRGRLFQVHPPTHSRQRKLPGYDSLLSTCWLCFGGRYSWSSKVPKKCVWEAEKGEIHHLSGSERAKVNKVGGNCAGILRRQSSSGVCSAGGKSILELDLACSLWHKAFIMLRRCFRVTLEIYMMMILPWARSTPLFKTVNPWQAQAMRSQWFMASSHVPPLCFPHEDKEEEMGMNPACFLSAVIGTTYAKSGVKFELRRAYSLLSPNSECPSWKYWQYSHTLSCLGTGEDGCVDRGSCLWDPLHLPNQAKSLPWKTPFSITYLKLNP